MGTAVKIIRLGKTGIETVQNAFGALPIQRVDEETAVSILRRAYEGGMRFFDTARAYTDSEEKLGLAFAGLRDKVYLASKTMAKTPEEFWKQLETTLVNLKTDYLDLYQLHFAERCYRPGDGSGLYESLLEAKAQGKIRHIGITAHKLGVAEDCVDSGLYETLQFPLCYLSSEKELGLVEKCREKNVGLIAMKGLAGGLITRSDAAFAFMNQFDNVLPIWGIQSMAELEEWLSYMEDAPEMNGELEAFIAKERQELSGNFCRGCGYCLPCPVGIKIPTCARMSRFLRRTPSEDWLNGENQEMMRRVEDCIHCGQCSARCPYELDTPGLLERNYADYLTFLNR